MAQISQEILQAALAGLRQQEKHIQEQITEVQQMLGGKAVASSADTDGSTGKPRRFSAASRRKMAEAQKARWARLKGESPSRETALAPEPPKRKRQLSAAGRKAIADAVRKRWAAKRAAEATSVAKKMATRAAKSGRKAAAKKAATKKTAARVTKKAAAKAAPAPTVAAAGGGA